MLIKDWQVYLHSYKQKEVKAVFGDFPEKTSRDSCLEIGSGDGFQANLIKGYFNFLVSTERNVNSLKEKASSIHYCVCDAKTLPFKDNSFDVVFSSNVIEHIEDRAMALKALRRALKKGGTAIHIVPSRTWKILSFLLLYPYLLALLFNSKELKRRLNEKQEKTRGRNMNKTSILKYLLPQVHGEYKSHISEFLNYGEKEWRVLFEKNGFTIKNSLRLPFLTSGYGFNCGWIKKFLEKKGLSSSYAFFMVCSSPKE